jgi:hypothetical protein
MLSQQAYMFIHLIISLQFINTCEENNKTFVLLPQKY